MFIAMQIVGALVAIVLARWWNPTLADADLEIPRDASGLA